MRCPACGSKGPHLCGPAAAEAVEFIANRCVHTKGRWAGERFVLAGWQRERIVEPIFGRLVFDADLKAWVRQIRTAYIEIPRKQGKSSSGAAIALKLTFADGESGAEVYSVAEDTDQANIIFGQAKAMVEASPALSRRAKVYKRLIEVPKTGNIYRVLPGDAAGAHGLNVHGCVFDELHTQRSRDLWDVMTSAQGTRTQPLTIAFSTAGTDRLSVCREQHDYGERLAAGLLADPSFHYVRYGFAEGDDWEDEDVWRRCNPALGDFVLISFLRSEYRKAKASPGRENAFRNLYLNEWTQQRTRWISVETWDAAGGLVPESDLSGACWGGLDASRSQHVAALHWLFPGETLRSAWRFFCPEDALEGLDEVTGGQASGWARQGLLKVTEGNLIDSDAIVAQVAKDAKRFDVREVALKPGGLSAPIAARLQDMDVAVVQVTQTVNNLSAGTHELERRVLDGSYRHGGHPVMRWMVDAAAVKRDSADRMKPDPSASGGNITGVLAAVMALDRWLRHDPVPEGSAEWVQSTGTLPEF